MANQLHYVLKQGKPDYYIASMARRGAVCDTRAMKFRLLQLRNERGLTQAQVAEHLGISQSLYAGLESGKRRMNETYMQGLAELYKIKATHLISDSYGDDPIFHRLSHAFEQLTPDERKILVAQTEAILALRHKSKEQG